MLKIVPDPPHPLTFLENTLMLAANYALCAEALGQVQPSTIKALH